MTKTKSIIILCFAILIVIFSGCSMQENNLKSELPTNTTASSTEESTTQIVKVTEKKTISETTTQTSENSDTTARPAKQKSAGQSTTKKVTTTQKSTTTQGQTTTKKVTTTQKSTTTKKMTTTEDEWDCNVDGHSCNVGPIGWVNSFDAATDKALEYIAAQDASGNFRVKQCHNCGKYTAEITLR